jgi:hypothetical protein
MEIQIWKGFRRVKAPETGRAAVQLTEGDGTCYPLYYFIDSITPDGETVIYHRALKGDVQLFKLDLRTGDSLQISHGKAENTWWRPWCVDSGRGVLDHRSVLNAVRGQVLYFDDRDLRQVDLATLEDRLLFSLPADRTAIGQNCVSVDGKWFIYIHHDSAVIEEIYKDFPPVHRRELSRGTVLAAFNFNTGEHRELVRINSPIHHVFPWGNEQFLFCHPATENGMLLTDLRGGWYTHLRTQDSLGGCICHYIATEAGVMYEVLGGTGGVRAGIYNPATHAKFEFRMPAHFGYTHTGRDPLGKLWFFENEKKTTEGVVHDMHFLARHVPGGADEWMALTGNWPTYGGGQKSHFHPQLTADRKWILMTAGDQRTGTNHLHLLDVSELHATDGIPSAM